MQGYKFRNLFQLCERMNVIQSIISNNYYPFFNLNSIEKIEDELDRIAKYEYVLYWIGTNCGLYHYHLMTTSAIT